LPIKPKYCTHYLREELKCFPPRGTEEYLRRKREAAEALIQRAEKIIPGLSKRIIVLDAATPKTFERYASMPEGSNLHVRPIN